MAKVSIIIPIYNVEKYVRKTIDSVINQTEKDIEIILVDDGSTDGSSNICDQYLKVDNRIKVIHKKMAVYHLHGMQELKKHQVDTLCI